MGFDLMADWCKANYILGAGTHSGSDEDDHDGIVDGHAYSVLTANVDVAGTGIDLIQVRNPWGKGEFKSGQWDDDGPGWDEHPDIFNELRPTKADNGIFWMSKEEFFQYFPTVYVCAMNM